MKPISVIPTLCTLGNAFCGFLAIAKGADAVATLSVGTDGAVDPARIARFYSLMATACWLIFLAMVFDALDGRIARITQQTSDFGGVLDSLTDMLTFGAAPALLLKFLFESTRRLDEQPFSSKIVLLLTVLYTCCAALRLARFTLMTEEEADAHDFFAGLPTPAAAGVLAAAMLFFIHQGGGGMPRLLQLPEEVWSAQRNVFLGAVLLCCPLLGLLMISHVPYVHLVNRYMRGRRPYTYVAQIVFVLFLVAILEIWALLLGFAAYVVTCPIVLKWEAYQKRRLKTGTARGDSS